MITIYRCVTCRHESMTKKESDTHMDENHSIRCKICDYRTLSPMYFESHMEYSHSVLPRYTCKICNEEFVGTDEVDKHLDFAHGKPIWSRRLASKQAGRTLQKLRDSQE